MFEPRPTYARVTRASVLCALTLVLAAGTARSSALGPLAPADAQAIRELAATPYAIVQLSAPRSPCAAAVLRSAGATVVSRTLGMWRVRSDVARRLLPPLMSAGLVAEAAPDLPLAPLGRLAPSDPLAEGEWWRSVVGADGAVAPGPAVRVTVVDRGVDLTHPEFSGRLNTVVLNPQSFTDEDDRGHATAVASVVAAPANGVGVVGVYPEAALQLWDASPDGTIGTSDLIRGIDTASARGRSVINLSLGFSGDFFVRTRNVIQQSVYMAVARGSLVVAAAGNGRDSGSPAFYPADLTHVLTVSATDEQGNVAGFSSASQSIDIAAPGFRIPIAVPLSIDPTGYGLGTGTSYAAPIVAGAAAWVWSMRPSLRTTQVFDLMRLSARDLGPPGFDDDTGFGMLDIPAALAAPAPPPDPLEPNDDVLFVVRPFWAPKEQSERPLTAPGRLRGAILARIDRAEDPHDVYRVWLPPYSTVTVALHADGDADLQLWGKDTRSVLEVEAFRHDDLLGASSQPGTGEEAISYRNRGKEGRFLYADVFPGRDTRSAAYALTVTTRFPPAVPR